MSQLSCSCKSESVWVSEKIMMTKYCFTKRTQRTSQDGLRYATLYASFNIYEMKWLTHINVLIIWTTDIILITKNCGPMQSYDKRDKRFSNSTQIIYVKTDRDDASYKWVSIILFINIGWSDYPQMNGYPSLQDCLYRNEKVLNYSWNTQNQKWYWNSYQWNHSSYAKSTILYRIY